MQRNLMCGAGGSGSSDHIWDICPVLSRSVFSLKSKWFRLSLRSMLSMGSVVGFRLGLPFWLDKQQDKITLDLESLGNVKTIGWPSVTNADMAGSCIDLLRLISRCCIPEIVSRYTAIHHVQRTLCIARYKYQHFLLFRPLAVMPMPYRAKILLIRVNHTRLPEYMTIA